MVTTKKDGTKVKEYLDPDDPRIAEIGITRKLKPFSGGVGTAMKKTAIKESSGIKMKSVDKMPRAMPPPHSTATILSIGCPPLGNV